MWLGSATGTRYEDGKARFKDAARRFRQATAELAAEGRFGGPDQSSTEDEIMDEANGLLGKVNKNRDALMRIGLDALGRGRELGRVPSCRDLDAMNSEKDVS